MCIAQAVKHLITCSNQGLNPFYHILVTQKLFCSVVGVSLKPPPHLTPLRHCQGRENDNIWDSLNVQGVADSQLDSRGQDVVRVTVEFSLSSHLGDSPQSQSVFKTSSHLTESLGDHGKPQKPYLSLRLKHSACFLPPDTSLQIGAQGTPSPIAFKRAVSRLSSLSPSWTCCSL